MVERFVVPAPGRRRQRLIVTAHSSRASGPAMPTGLTARIRIRWVPMRERLLERRGAGFGTSVPSRLHWNVEPAMVEVKTILTFGLARNCLGRLVIEVSGAGQATWLSADCGQRVLGEVAVAVAVDVRLEHRRDVGAEGLGAADVQDAAETNVGGGVGVEARPSTSVGVAGEPRRDRAGHVRSSVKPRPEPLSGRDGEPDREGVELAAGVTVILGLAATTTLLGGGRAVRRRRSTRTCPVTLLARWEKLREHARSWARCTSACRRACGLSTTAAGPRCRTSHRAGPIWPSVVELRPWRLAPVGRRVVGLRRGSLPSAPRASADTVATTRVGRTRSSLRRVPTSGLGAADGAR